MSYNEYLFELKNRELDSTWFGKIIPNDFISKTDLNNLKNKLQLDLENNNISFNYFYGGDLIIWGNNYWFANDIEQVKSETSAEIIYNINSNLVTVLNEDFGVSETIRFLQTVISANLDVKENQGLITIKSNSINVNYSTLSFRNNYSDIYLYNLKIENTLSSGDIIYKQYYDIIQYNSIIAFWPLEKNGIPTIINEQYLPKTQSFTLLSQNIKYLSGLNVQFNHTISSSLPENFETSDIPISSIFNISASTMNTTNNLNNVGVLNPGFFHFDILSENGNINVKTQSNYIKDIIYNKNNKTPNITIGIWCYQQANDFTNNPFITDYDFATLSGIIIGPDVIEMRYPSLPSQLNKTKDIWYIRDTDFSNYNHQLRNKWVLYFYEFQHSTSAPLYWPENLENNNGKVVNEFILQSNTLNNKYTSKNPEPGFMRVNIHAIYTDKNNKIVHKILAPTYEDVYENNAEVTAFKIPDIDPIKNLIIGGVKLNSVISNVPTDGYALWNGKMRNLIILNTYLTHNQMCNYYRSSIQSEYIWAQSGQFNVINSIGDYSFLGSLYAYNTRNLNVQGCILKQNVKHLKDITFNTDNLPGLDNQLITIKNINTYNRY